MKISLRLFFVLVFAATSLFFANITPSQQQPQQPQQQAYQMHQMHQMQPQQQQLQQLHQQQPHQQHQQQHQQHQPQHQQPQQQQVSFTNHRLDEWRLLDNVARDLHDLTDKQRRLIKENPGSQMAIVRAIKMTINECQYQFKDDKWNCPIFNYTTRTRDIFGKIVQRGCRETGFIYSLFSSAIAHSVAKGCTESMITSCVCVNDDSYSNHHNHHQHHQRQQQQQHCGDNIEFGIEFARAFLANDVSKFTSPATSRNDLMRKKPTQKHQKRQKRQKQQQQQPIELELMTKKDRELLAIMNAHNSELGRSVVDDRKKLKCKCHGVSGSCTFETCWMRLPDFRDVSNRLHEKYNDPLRIVSISSKQLTSSNNNNKNKRSQRQTSSYKYNNNNLIAYNSHGVKLNRAPARDDLVYYDDSPDFCIANDRFDVKGTRGRTCNETSTGPDSCDNLCCGRGYKTEIREERYKCEFELIWVKPKFKWCSRKKTTHSCL